MTESVESVVKPVVVLQANTIKKNCVRASLEHNAEV